MLGRVRAALGASAGGAPAPGGEVPGGEVPGGEVPGGEVPRRYRLRGDVGASDLLDLLAGRLADYRSLVRRTTPAGLAAAIGASLTEPAAPRALVPPGLRLPAPPSSLE